VIPAFNEEMRLESSVKILLKFLKKHFGKNFEVIISEDGSTDKTYQIALMISKKFSNVKVIKNRHIGKGHAIVKGFEHANGDIVGFVDADLSTDINFLPEVIEKIKNGADISIGSRYVEGNRIVKRTFGRWFVSKLYNLLIQIIFSSKIKDHQCGFKFFKKNSVMKLIKKVKNKKFVWDSELLIRAQREGYRIAEVPVNWTEKKGGQLKISKGIIQMLIDALKLWKELNF
jgi:glycosyltransferase involved in cell wall biosynthesis